jgi:hypothetical protein
VDSSGSHTTRNKVVGEEKSILTATISHAELNLGFIQLSWLEFLKQNSLKLKKSMSLFE